MLSEEIKKLKKEKNAVILAHYYCNDDVQDVVDILGDSLLLSQKAAETSADIILFAGVRFMAETAKILSPDKKVLLADFNTNCSLSDSCNAVAFKEFLKKYPEHKVISYVNTTAEIKAMSDLVCTSGNAVKIVNSFPADTPLIFGPDKNLGAYINKITGRNMVLWQGCCGVHANFSAEKILKLKSVYPDAQIIAHPECEAEILNISDFISSTSGLADYVVKSPSNQFIVVTEPGILHQMKLRCPDKTFIPAPGKGDNEEFNICKDMKLNTLEKIYDALKNETPEVFVDEQLSIKAKKSIDLMLELSK